MGMVYFVVAGVLSTSRHLLGLNRLGVYFCGAGFACFNLGKSSAHPDDYEQAQKWYDRAEQLGLAVDTPLNRRKSSRAPGPADR